MTFHEQTLGNFLQIKDQATNLLRQEEVLRTSSLGFAETLVLQAASHVLLTETVFYGTQINDLARLGSGTIYPLLRRFEEVFLLTTSELETINPATIGRPARRLYTPTDLGGRVFSLFQSAQNRSEL